MNDFAATHRRWGYKRAWARAKSEGIVVGRDTFRRLWRAEGLRVRPRKAPKPRTAPRLQRLVKASAPGQVWAIDFQFDSDWKGRVFKVCNLIDEFTRQHLAFRVERRIGAADVIEMLDLAALAHGAPQVLRADNGPEFIAAAMGRWASEHDTLQAFIPPGQPWHNGFVESLHNRMRDELLEDNMFEDLNHARALIGAWSHWACAQVVDGLFMRLLSRPLGVVRIRWGICRRGWCGCGGGCRSLRSRWRPRCRPGRGW